MTYRISESIAPRAAVFGIGSDARDAAHAHDIILNIYLHPVYYDHGCELFFVKPAENIGFLKNGAFGGFYLTCSQPV